MTKRKTPLNNEDSLTTQFEDYLRRPSRQKLAAVVRLAHAPTWNLALRITGNHADAADLCQDVFLSLLLSPPSPGSIRSPLGYLSARVLTVDRRRRRSYERRRQREEKVAREILTNVEAPGDAEALRLALDELPGRIQVALKLRYFAGLKNREIAASMGLSVRAIEEYLRQGREALERKINARTLGLLFMIGEQPPLSPPAGFLDNLLRVVEDGAALAREAVMAEDSTPSSSGVSSSTVSNLRYRSFLPRWGFFTTGGLLVLAAGLLLVQKLTQNPVESSGSAAPVASNLEIETAATGKTIPPPLAPSSFTVRGAVQDASQKPLPGCTVSLRKEGKEVGDGRTTAAEGTFLFSEVSPDDYTLRVHHPVWGELEINLGPVKDNHQVDLHFEASSSITGEIVGRKYDDPESFARHAKVWIEGPLRTPREARGFEGARQVELEPYSFRVEDLEPGVFCLYGGMSFGQVFERIVTIEKNGEQVEVEVNIKDNPKKVLQGTAYLGDWTSPLTDAKLQGYVKSPAISGNIGLIRTDARGEFFCESERLLTGSHVLLRRGQNLPAAELLYTTPLGEEDHYEVIFPAPSPRKARVSTPAGQAVPYVSVTFSQRETVPRRFNKRANRQGEFGIPEIEPGTYEVEIQSANEKLAVTGASRGHFNRYKILVDDSDEDLIIEVDPGRCMILEVATTWDSLQRLPILHPRHIGWGGAQEKRPRPSPEKQVAYFTTSLFARVTVSGPTIDSKTFWELKDAPPRRLSILRSLMTGRYDIIVDELDQDEIRYPFLLSGIPDGAVLQVQILASRIGWKAVVVNTVDIDIDPYVRVTLEAPPLETLVEVTDRAGSHVNDARFEIPYFTSSARESHGRKARRLQLPDFGDVSAGDINPYLGILKKFTFVTGEGDERPGKWIEPGGPQHPTILREGPGKYRLLVYPGEDFPILVTSPVAGEHLVYGDQLLRSPRVSLE